MQDIVDDIGSYAVVNDIFAPTVTDITLGVPYSNSKVYYKYGKPDGTYDTEQSEFPEGFRMIAGNARLRASDR